MVNVNQGFDSIAAFGISIAPLAVMYVSQKNAQIAQFGKFSN
jgi:hypothetical protein